MSDEEDNASIITGGVGYNIGSPSVLSSSRNSFESISNYSFSSEFNSTFNLNQNGSQNTTYSPLGANSIYELVAGVDSKRKNKIAIMVNNKTTKISLGPPTVNDIPQIKLPKLTKVEDQSFDEYLKSINKQFEIFQSNRNLTQSALTSINEVSDDADKELHRNHIENVPKVYFQDDFRLDDPRIFYKVIEGNEILNKDVKSDKNDISLMKTNEQFLINNGLLQEKLSWYLDIIEIHLIDEISQSSDSFFNTFNDLSEIAKNSQKCIDKSKKLMVNFNRLEQEQCELSFKILKNLQKKLNLLKLQQSMIQINLILKISDYAELVYYKGNNGSNSTEEEIINNHLCSLNLINLAKFLIVGDFETFEIKFKKIIETDPNHSYFIPNTDVLTDLVKKCHLLFGNSDNKIQNLSNIQSLKNLLELLSNLKEKVGKSLNNLFIDFLISDLTTGFRISDSTSVQNNLIMMLLGNLKYDNKIITQNFNHFLESVGVTKNDNFNNIKRNLQTSSLMEITVFKKILIKYLYGLIISNEIFDFFKSFQEKLIVEFKNVIKFHLPITLGSTTPSQKTSSTNLQALSGESKIFNPILLNTYTNSFETYKHHYTSKTLRLQSEAMETNSNGSTTISNLNSNSANSNQILVNNLRSMSDPVEFEVILVNIFSSLLASFKKVSFYQKILLDLSLDLLQYLPSDTHPQSNQLEDNVLSNLDLSSTISKLIEIVNKRLFKIVNIKADQISNCSITSYDYFIKFYLLNKVFLIDLENLSVQQQLQPMLDGNEQVPPNFLSRFLSKEIYDYYISYTTILKKNTIDIIEADTWKDLTNVPNGEELRQVGQLLVDEIISLAENAENIDDIAELKQILTRLPSSWVEVVGFTQYLDPKIKKIGLENSNPIEPPATATEQKEEIPVSKSKQLKKLEVRIFGEIHDMGITGNEFDPIDDNSKSVSLLVPNSVISILQFIKEILLLHLTLGKQHTSFPFVLVDLIRLTNSKMRQQVLGANATQTTDLKHITVKHLAICSQASELFIRLIPFISKAISMINLINFNKKDYKRSKEIYSNNNNSDSTNDINLEGEFKNLAQSLRDHQNDVFTKLISLMNDRVTNHAIELSRLDFSEPLPANSNCHKYMEVLVKETIVISKTLTKTLSKQQYLIILSEIFNNYKKTLLKEFEKFSSATNSKFIKNSKIFKDNFEKMNLLKDIDYFRVKLGDIPGYGESGTVLWKFVNDIKTKEDVEMEAKMQDLNQAMKQRASEELVRKSEELENIAEPNKSETKVDQNETFGDNTDADLTAVRGEELENFQTKNLLSESSEAPSITITLANNPSSSPPTIDSTVSTPSSSVDAIEGSTGSLSDLQLEFSVEDMNKRDDSNDNVSSQTNNEDVQTITSVDTIKNSHDDEIIETIEDDSDHENVLNESLENKIESSTITEEPENFPKESTNAIVEPEVKRENYEDSIQFPLRTENEEETVMNETSLYSKNEEVNSEAALKTEEEEKADSTEDIILETEVKDRSLPVTNEKEIERSTKEPVEEPATESIEEPAEKESPTMEDKEEEVKSTVETITEKNDNPAGQLSPSKKKIVSLALESSDPNFEESTETTIISETKKDDEIAEETPKLSKSQKKNARKRANKKAKKGPN